MLAPVMLRPEDLDMARRRLQQQGDLRVIGGWWKLRWRVDTIKADGATSRGWSKLVLIGPAVKGFGMKPLTETEAKREAWTQWLSKLDQHQAVPQSVATVEDFVNKRFRPEHIDAKRPKTRQFYESLLKLVLPALGNKRLRDVRHDDIQQLASSVLRSTYRIRRRVGTANGKPLYREEEHPYSAQVAHHVRTVCSAIFTHAKTVGWYAGDNPAEKVVLPELERVREAHALSFDQLKALVQALGPPLRDMVIVACLTGMNAAEMTGLKWKRINLSDSWATSDGESLPPWSLLVREQWILASKAMGGYRFGPVKRKSRRRPLPIPEVLREVLAALKNRKDYVGPDDPVFVGATGKPVDHHNLANRGLKKIGAALQMPWLSWHVFRRTNTTLADELGLSLQDRQSLMGHSDAAMTMHYTKESMERRRGVLDVLGGAIGKVM